MRRWRWDNFAVHSHSFDMELDRLSDELAGVLERRGGSDTPRKVGNVSAKAGVGWFKENCVLGHLDLWDVWSKSAERCPAMVTVPGFQG